MSFHVRQRLQAGPSSGWHPQGFCKPPVVRDLQQVLRRDHDMRSSACSGWGPEEEDRHMEELSGRGLCSRLRRLSALD